MGKHLHITDLSRKDFACGVRTLRFLDANFELNEEFLYSLPIQLVQLKKENEKLKQELEDTNAKLQALIDQTEANFQAFNDRMSELMTSNRIARENMLQKNDSLVELNLDYGR